MACLGLEPGAAGWYAQTNPLSYGGTLKIQGLNLFLLLVQSVCNSFAIFIFTSSISLIFFLPRR